MKFTGIAAMLAVVTAVTGAAIPNINGALAEVHQATGDVKGLLSSALGTQDEAKVNKLVSQLEKVQAELAKLTKGQDKRQLLDLGVDADVEVKRDVGSNLGNTVEGVTTGAGKAVNGVVSGAVKRQGDLLSGVTDTVDETLGGVLKRQGDLLSGVTDTVDETLGGALKRDDPVSSLANQLLPQLTQNGILKDVSVEQLTGLLKILNVNGLLTNVESVLSSLLNGGLLQGLTGDLLGGIKRDDAISTLASKLLPELTNNGILPEAVNLQQLTGLLSILNVNGLLTNVESTVSGLLNGLGLQGLTGGLLGALHL